MTAAVQPGDVILVRSAGFAGFMIRLGAAFRNRPSLSNHVAVVHHRDAKGILWAVEGRPGGAGWRDTAAYLASKWTQDNSAQPKTAEQRAAICTTMETMIATDYDWSAIIADAAASLNITLPGWDPTWRGTVPAHVVCSSLAAYGYAKAGLAHPAGDRGCTPGDWNEWVITRAWEAPAK